MIYIAHIENDYTEKFGIPRQSGMVSNLSKIVFEKEFAIPDAIRGIEDFNYIWLIWDFSEMHRVKWSPTVRPPVLGGNRRMGVFATRSPNRPNSIGLSSVRLVRAVSEGEGAPYLVVEGADLMNGTPILDIKPYVFSDCHPDATEGFNSVGHDRHVDVVIPEDAAKIVPAEKLEALKELLSCDPRPSYQNDPQRVYGLSYGGFEIKFSVDDKILIVKSIEKSSAKADSPA